MPSQAAAEATRALLERVVEIGARRLQRRRQAEDQTGRERDDHRERKHGAVDADLLNVRQVEPAQRAKDAGAPEREQQPSAPPSSESNALSVSSWRTRRSL